MNLLFVSVVDVFAVAVAAASAGATVAVLGVGGYNAIYQRSKNLSNQTTWTLSVVVVDTVVAVAVAHKIVDDNNYVASLVEIAAYVVDVVVVVTAASVAEKPIRVVSSSLFAPADAEATMLFENHS